MRTIVFIVIGILIGLILSYPEIKKIVSIYRTPIYRINKLPTDGKVIVFGRAESKNTKSPIKNTNCSLWQVQILEYPYINNWSRSWKTIYSQMSQEPFELGDETGKIQIFPANAQLILYDDLHNRGNLKIGIFRSPLSPRIKSAIEELGITTTNYFGIERPLSVYERIIKPGDEVYVHGEIKYENGSKVIKDGAPFVISDRREYKILGALFKKIAVNVVFTTIIVVVVFLVLSNQ